MPSKIGQLVSRNWPIKLAALFFSIMLYVAVAAQQPITQTLTLRLNVDGPPGRPVKEQPTDIAVQISGKGSELLKMRSLPHRISRAIPDTFSGSVWHLRLQPSDVPLPKGADILVADISPRDIDVTLDSAAHKEVRVASRVTVQADSGFLIQGLAVLPATVYLVGPAKEVAAIDSVPTTAATISSVSGPFFHTVPLDTAALGPVRVIPREVRVSGEVTPLLQRSFTGVLVTTAATGFSGLELATERVVVEASGPEPRVQALTRDSLRVVAHLVGHALPDAYARLTVTAPGGISARAVPDSLAVKAPAVKAPAVKPPAVKAPPPKPTAKPPVRRKPGG